MTTEQAMDIINTVFKTHWPNWIFEDEETIFWIKQLQKYDFDKAKAAINNLYATWENQGKPPAGRIIKCLGMAFNFPENSGKLNVKDCLYRILKPNQKNIMIADNNVGGMGYTGNPYVADQSIEIAANNDLARCEKLYGKPCTVIRTWEGQEFRKKYRPEEFVNTENSQEQDSPDNY